MRRLRPVIGGLIGVALFALLLMGGESAVGIPLLPLLLAGPLLVGLLWTRRSGTTVPDRGWAGPQAVAPEVGLVRRPPAPRSVAAALGRVEARELVTSTWFGIGVGFGLLIFGLFGFAFASDNRETWVEYLQMAPWMVHPLVGMTLVAGHRAVTRARRDDAEELFESCPTEPLTRTVGFLWAAVVPMAAIVVVLAATVVANAVRSPLLHGPVGGDSAADLAAAVVLGAGGLALGVALGLWVRFALAPIVAIGAIALATTSINGIGGHGWNPLVPLSTAPTIEGSPVFADRAPEWHLLWVVGLTLAVAIVALARHRRDGRMIGLAVGTAVLLLACGIVATRPMPAASAERIASRIAHPEAHQECTAVREHVEACVFPVDRELLTHVLDRIRVVAAELPSDMPRLSLRQAFDGRLGDVPPEVRRHLTADDLVRPAHDVRLEFEDDDLDVIPNDAGFALAFGAVGLPSVAGPDLLPVVAAGQARGVVSIWLGARGLDADQTREVSTSPYPGSADAFERGSTDGGGDCSVPAVVWSAQDLAAARAILALPADVVGRALRSDWGRWTDPATSTDDLLAALGLPLVGPFDRVEARPGDSC